MRLMLHLLFAERWRRAAGLGLAAIALLAPLLVWPAHPSQAQGGCDVAGTPYFTEYYGQVTLDSQPAPIGALVEAFNSEGVRAGCFEVIIPGLYGYMRVYGADPETSTPGMGAGEPVIFKVDGALAASTPPTVFWSGDQDQHEVVLSAASLPDAVFDLQIGQAGGDVLLTWSDVGGSVDHYEVWRSAAPYFTPGGGDSQRIAAGVAANPGGSVSYTDATGHLGNPALNDAYVVLAIDSGGQASPPSNRVAEFDFAVAPGDG